LAKLRNHSLLAQQQLRLCCSRVLTVKLPACVVVFAALLWHAQTTHMEKGPSSPESVVQQWKGIATKQKEEIAAMSAKILSLEKAATDWEKLAALSFQSLQRQDKATRNVKEDLAKQKKASLKLRNDADAAEQRAMTCERELEKKDA
ncbi:unnamed protein product, partial [Amoebophrya sp. A25]